jgi:hypothetical protein
MWQRVFNQLKREMTQYDSKPDSFEIPFEALKHEQEILRDDVLPSMLAKGELKVMDLDRCLYASGLWYTQKELHVNRCGSTVPSVLNNNWIQGNNNKIQRATQNKHWFLNGTKCLDWNTRLQEAINTFL